MESNGTTVSKYRVARPERSDGRAQLVAPMVFDNEAEAVSYANMALDDGDEFFVEKTEPASVGQLINTMVLIGDMKERCAELRLSDAWLESINDVTLSKAITAAINEIVGDIDIGWIVVSRNKYVVKKD